MMTREVARGLAIGAAAVALAVWLGLEGAAGVLAFQSPAPMCPPGKESPECVPWRETPGPFTSPVQQPARERPGRERVMEVQVVQVFDAMPVIVAPAPARVVPQPMSTVHQMIFRRPRAWWRQLECRTAGLC